jgi:hypothetical protein
MCLGLVVWARPNHDLRRLEVAITEDGVSRLLSADSALDEFKLLSLKWNVRQLWHAAIPTLGSTDHGSSLDD